MVRAFIAVTVLLCADGRRKIRKGLEEGLGRGSEEGLEAGLEEGLGESLEEYKIPPCVSDLEWDHFKEVNLVRRAGFMCPNGRKRKPVSKNLVFDCPLWRASWLHSMDQVTQGYGPSHRSKDGRTESDRAGAQGVNWSGENVAERNRKATGKAFVTQFLRSNLHCWTMGGPNHQTFGGGYAINDNNKGPISIMTQMYSHSNPIKDNTCLCGKSLISLNDTKEDDEDTLLTPLADDHDDEEEEDDDDDETA